MVRNGMSILEDDMSRSGKEQHLFAIILAVTHQLKFACDKETELVVI